LQAAGLDTKAFFAGVVALEPNMHVRGYGRAMYDYATEAAIWLPCALSSERFASTPFARSPNGQLPPAWPIRCASLRAQGKLSGNTPTEQAEQAYDYLHTRGWNDEAMRTAASTTAFDLWRVIAAGYASSYLRRGATDMPCGFHPWILHSAKRGGRIARAFRRVTASVCWAVSTYRGIPRWPAVNACVHCGPATIISRRSCTRRLLKQPCGCLEPICRYGWSMVPAMACCRPHSAPSPTSPGLRMRGGSRCTGRFRTLGAVVSRRELACGDGAADAASTRCRSAGAGHAGTSLGMV
jgi:hypothetical protein